MLVTSNTAHAVSARHILEEELTDPDRLPWLDGQSLGDVADECLGSALRWALRTFDARWNRVTADPRAPARIAGLDVARALALFGMFAAHIGNVGRWGPGGWRWLLATHGRASARLRAARRSLDRAHARDAHPRPA